MDYDNQTQSVKLLTVLQLGRGTLKNILFLVSTLQQGTFKSQKKIELGLSGHYEHIFVKVGKLTIFYLTPLAYGFLNT